MASFSHQQHNPFLHDSVFQTSNINNPIKMYGFVDNYDQGNINTNFLSQTYNYPSDQFYQKSHFDSKNSSFENSDNEVSDVKKQSVDSSSMVDRIESGEQVNSMDKKKKNREGSSLNSAKFKEGKEGKEGKGRKQRKCNGELSNLEKKSAINEKIKNVDEAPLGYIHVRARRGQATDSHSLAERVRREKISQRMKLLQALVPGCDKVTGKALMLEEIINYVQSLQNQVEFLSMKLASLNPLIYDFGVDPDALMMKSEKFNGLASSPSLPFVQQCSPTHHPNGLADSAHFNPPPTNHYSIVDPSVLVQHGPRLVPFNQENGSQLWEVDGQKQKLINLSGLFSNNMCSFN